MRQDQLAEMINRQIIPRGVKDGAVLAAMKRVPRDEFIPAGLNEHAYDDNPLPIGDGQTISQPYMVARMTELLALSGTEKVLEIGTGSGYQTAVLAELAREVFTIERHVRLAEKAEAVLKKLGYTNVYLRSGDGTEGWPEKAPFDRIIVTAAAEKAPYPLLDQLAQNGKLLIPLGGPLIQQLTLIEKHSGEFLPKEYDTCVFVPLMGKYS